MSNLNLQKKIIFKKFRVGKLIYKSNLAIIHEGKNELNGEQIAMKFEREGGKYNFLESEAYLLFLLKGTGIPKIISYGKTIGFKVLIEELLGESIYLIWKNKKYDMRTKFNDICLIAIQCLDRLEYIHSKNVIHRDIKPFNFLFGKKDPNMIYLIDFGISRKYRSSRTGKHIKFEKIKKTSGSLRYMSINGIKGYEQSRRDDLESLGYMIVYLIKKTLPWLYIENLKISKGEKYKKIREIKTSTIPEEICSGLPKEFCQYIKYCRNLKFEQEPNYNYLRNLFLEIIKKNEQIPDIKFIRLMQFSWLAKKNIKIGKIESIYNARNNLITGTKTDSILGGMENTHKRLYKKIKDSIEKAKSQDLPKIRNKNFFKFDLKNINIILNNINSTGENNNNQNIKKNSDTNAKLKEKNIFSIMNNSINKSQQREPYSKKNIVYINRLKILKKIPRSGYDKNSTDNNVYMNIRKKFRNFNLNAYKIVNDANKSLDFNFHTERKGHYKTLEEREQLKKSNKIKTILNKINYNNFSINYGHDINIIDNNDEILTEKRKKIYINNPLINSNLIKKGFI